MTDIDRADKLVPEPEPDLSQEHPKPDEVLVGQWFWVRSKEHRGGKSSAVWRFACVVEICGTDRARFVGVTTSTVSLSTDASDLLRFIYRRQIGVRLNCSTIHAEELGHLTDHDLRKAWQELRDAGYVSGCVVYHEATPEGLREAERRGYWTQVNAFGAWLWFACFFADGTSDA